MVRAERRRLPFLDAATSPAVAALTATVLVDIAALLEIGLLEVGRADVQAALRSVQSLALVAALGLGALSVAAYLRARRVGGEAPLAGEARPSLWRAFRWSLYLTILFVSATWMLWNYRADRIMINRDAERYAAVASQPLFSTAFWTGGNPPGFPLLMKTFGLTTQAFESERLLAIARRITQVQTVASFLAVGALAVSVASVVRRRWLRPLAVLGIFGLGLAIDVAQWNKALLSESLSITLFFILVAGALQLGRWWDNRQSKRPPLLLELAAILALATAAFVFAFTRISNAYLLLALALVTVPVVLAAALRGRKHWLAQAAVVAAMILTGAAAATATDGGLKWSYPFVNVLYDRILPAPAAVAFFVRQGFPLDTIDNIQPKDATELHIAFRGDSRAEPLRTWFLASGRGTYLKYLISRPIETLRAPLPRFDVWLSPDLEQYRARLFPEPTWLLLASGAVYPKDPLVLLLWFVVVMVAALLLVRAGMGNPVWAVPLLIVAVLYPLELAIWHGDSWAIGRHSVPVALGLRLSLWLLTYFVLDAALAWRDARAARAVASARRTPQQQAAVVSGSPSSSPQDPQRPS